jgi:Fic family protein
MLDFQGVDIIDYSCADELVARLVVELTNNLYGSRFILLSGLDETIQENIAVALKQRSLAALLLLDSSNGEETNWQLIGEIKPFLKSALTLLIERNELTARDLANQEKLAINTASNRLVELAKLGLAHRRNEVPLMGGKQYIYTSIIPMEPV